MAVLNVGLHTQEEGVYTLRRSGFDRALLWAIGAPASLGLVAGAVALVVYARPLAVSPEFGVAVALVLLGLALAWVLVRLESVVELTPTHIISRPLLLRPTAIPWAEVAGISKRPKQGLRIDSRLGARIDIGAGLANGTLWEGLRRYVPVAFHSQLSGLPGFEQAPVPSGLQRTGSLLIGLAISMSSLIAGRIDWSVPDARCMRESVGAFLGPKQSCLERAAAAHDVEWMVDLIGKGANPGRADKRGNTALHAAVVRNFPDGVRLLLDSGADMFRRNAAGHSALELALAAKDYESLGVMLQHVRTKGSRDAAQVILRTATAAHDAKLLSMVKTDLGPLLPRVADPVVQHRYENLLRQASAAYDRGDFGRAIADAEEAIKLDPDAGPAYFMSGAAYGEMKNWGRAKSRIRRALELMPDNVELLHHQGMLFYLTGEYEQAEDSFTQAIRRQPDAWDVYSDRALNRADLGRNQAAIDDAAVACRHDVPDSCEIEQSLRRHLAD